MSIIYRPIPTKKAFEQKTLGEQYVLKARQRSKEVTQNSEEFETPDAIKPLIVFSFDMDGTLIYYARTLGEKERDLQQNGTYQKIHAPFLVKEIFECLKKFISHDIVVLPILVTSSVLGRVEDVILKTQSPKNILKDIFTPDQIFARGTFNAENHSYDIKKQDPYYSDAFIKKLQERGLIAQKDNIDILHFGDEMADKKFIQFLDYLSIYNNLFQDDIKPFVQITGQYIKVDLEEESCHNLLYRPDTAHYIKEELNDVLSNMSGESYHDLSEDAKANIQEKIIKQKLLEILPDLSSVETKEKTEKSIAKTIVSEIDKKFDILKEKFETLKNNKRPPDAIASSSSKKKKI